MFTKAIASTSFAILALGVFSTAPASAQVFVQVAPPAPRHEVVPPPRRGYVWAPGHWEWRNQRHAWVNGVWVRERRGYAYHAPQWADRGGRWEYRAGGWDRDHDGIPNRMDRHPNNGYRP